MMNASTGSVAALSLRAQSAAPDAPSINFQTEAAVCRPYLLRVATVQLRDRDLAEDVVQETLMAACEGFDRFEQRASFKTWLTGILKFKILDAIRKRIGEPVSASTLQKELNLDDIDQIFADSGARMWQIAPEQWRDPAASWEERHFFDMVDFCLLRLPPVTAQVFMMRELFEMAAGEIAAELGISAANLRVLMYRARMALRHCLELNWFSQSPDAL